MEGASCVSMEFSDCITRFLSPSPSSGRVGARKSSIELKAWSENFFDGCDRYKKAFWRETNKGSFNLVASNQLRASVMTLPLEEIPVSLDEFLDQQEDIGLIAFKDPDEDLWEAPLPEVFLSRALPKGHTKHNASQRQSLASNELSEAQPLARKPQQETKPLPTENHKLQLLKQRSQPLRAQTGQPNFNPNYQNSTKTSTSKVQQRAGSSGHTKITNTSASSSPAGITLATDNNTVIPKVVKHVHFSATPLHPHSQAQPQPMEQAVTVGSNTTTNVLVCQNPW